MTGSLLLLFLILGCFQSCTTANNVYGAGVCCFEFHKRPIPPNKIVSVEETRFDCTISAVIVTTARGFRVCADPAVQWVQQAMNNLKNPKSPNPQTPKPGSA